MFARSDRDSDKVVFWIAIAFLIIGVLFRWIDLGVRPLHHDESIHVMFGRYFFDWPNDNYYKYNPEYHGPLLYNLLRFVYDTLGDFEWSARALIAVFGTSILALPFLLRRYLGDYVFLVLVAFMSFSPTMIYWSRFVREDIFVIAGMAMMLYGVLKANPNLKSFWVLLGVVFQYTSKENSYVTMAMFWFYFAAEWTAKRILDKNKEPLPLSFLAPIPFALVMLFHIGMVKEGTAYVVQNRIYMDLAAALGGVFLLIDCLRNNWKQNLSDQSSLVVKLFAHIATYRIQFFVSFAFAAFLFCYLFSAGFRYSDGIIDGLYYKGITYWLEKHNIERIKGPFLFHFYQLAWYEVLFILLAIYQAVYFYRKSNSFIKFSALAAVVVAIAIGLFNKPATDQAWLEPSFALWKKFKAKDWFDIVGIVILVVHPILLTLSHWLRREWNLAVFAYLFSAGFFTYSYLGEKVPWLSSYPLIAGWMYLAAYFQSEFDKDNLSNLFNKISLGRFVGFFGWVILILGITFVVEDIARYSMLFPGRAFELSFVINNHQLLLIIGLIAIALDYVDRKAQLFVHTNAAVVCLVICSIFMMRMAYLANFEHKFRELGYITQVHTTYQTVQIANKIRSEILNAPDGMKPSVLVTGDGVWPLTWYFRDLPTYKFSATPEEKVNFKYIFQDEKDVIPSGFKQAKLALRGWWVPEFSQMTFRRFLAMSFNLRTWGGNGFSNVTYLEKE